jgi:large subunit ribosomal protein L29
VDIKEIRHLETVELEKRVKDLKKELLALRIKLSIGNEVKAHELKNVRIEVARILTVLHQRSAKKEVVYATK